MTVTYIVVELCDLAAGCTCFFFPSGLQQLLCLLTATVQPVQTDAREVRYSECISFSNKLK
jgi:hypothetical protein